jgi:cytochrome P450
VTGPTTDGLGDGTIARPPLPNPFAPELVSDPYPTYRRLLEEEPFFHERSGFWVVARHADVHQVLRDRRLGRADFAERARSQLGDGPLARAFTQFLLFKDPPDHTRLRGQIEEAVEELLDRVPADGTLELIGDVAYPLLVLVICALLGVPPQDRGDFRAWSSAVAEGLDAITNPQPEPIGRANAGAEALGDYFRGLIAERRARPRDDLVSDLIAARDGADRLSEEELLGTVVLLFGAGHETTVNLIGNGALALLTHPEQTERLRAEPVLLPGAIEELLRFDSPVQRTVRTATEDVPVGGRTVRAGERVMALLGAANRDPHRFADPDRLDVARSDAQHHVSFGGGIHYCLGAPLARLEAQIAIGALLRRLPDARLVDAQPTWRPTLVLRGLTRLPLARG